MILKDIEITNLGSELKVTIYVKVLTIPTYENEKINILELKNNLVSCILQKSSITEALLNGKKVSFRLIELR